MLVKCNRAFSAIRTGDAKSPGSIKIAFAKGEEYEVSPAEYHKWKQFGRFEEVIKPKPSKAKKKQEKKPDIRTR